jgi:hypothetical protein
MSSNFGCRKKTPQDEVYGGSSCNSTVDRPDEDNKYEFNKIWRSSQESLPDNARQSLGQNPSMMAPRIINVQSRESMGIGLGIKRIDYPSNSNEYLIPLQMKTPNHIHESTKSISSNLEEKNRELEKKLNDLEHQLRIST